MTRFTEADAERASQEWNCNCGPGALAAIMGLTLDEVRPHVEKAGFGAAKSYMNPTMMLDALNSAGAKWQAKGKGKAFATLTWPDYGLARIQWEGPWTEPGANGRWAYQYTHWVGSRVLTHIREDHNRTGIFDINAMANGSGWCRLADWQAVIVPAITEHHKRANGKWHITHSIEVERKNVDALPHPAHA